MSAKLDGFEEGVKVKANRVAAIDGLIDGRARTDATAVTRTHSYQDLQATLSALESNV